MCKSTGTRQGRANRRIAVRTSTGRRATCTPTSRTNQRPYTSHRRRGITIGQCIRIVHRFITRCSLIIRRMNTRPLIPTFRRFTRRTRTPRTPWIIPNTVVIRMKSHQYIYIYMSKSFAPIPVVSRKKKKKKIKRTCAYFFFFFIGV